jgi:tetratricopeptide (TPR) repeat protein
MFVSASVMPSGGRQLRTLLHGLGVRLLLILACLPGGLLCCEVAGAQVGLQDGSPHGAIEVHLRTANRAGFNASARVSLLSTGGPVIREGTVDLSGTTRFDGLYPGNYIVEASAPGFVTASETVNVEVNWGYVTVYLSLKPEDSANTATDSSSIPILAPNAQKELDKGLEALRHKDRVEARNHLEKALSMAPGNPVVQYLVGVLEYQENNIPAAQEHLEKAVQLSPNSLRALDLLGEVYCRQEHPEKAVPLLEKAVSVEGGSWKAHWKLAWAYLQTNEFAKAQQESERAIALGRADAGVAHVLNAEALANLGKWDAAESVLDAFVRDQPSDPAAPRARALLAELKQREKQAQEESPLPLKEPVSLTAIGDLIPQISPRLVSAWSKPGVDELVPKVAPDVSCTLPQVVAGAGRQVEHLMDSLERFEATERVEHFPVDKQGKLRSSETRSFDYVVSVLHAPRGAISLEEYRNGRLGSDQFPASMATNGLPAMATIFHPQMTSGFDFTCEGLGQVSGHPAWQVRFQQNPNQPNRIRAYVIAGNYYPIALKGRAWIDAATYQVVRLESELVKPIPQIHLLRERLSIDYAPVQFNSRNVQLWLPSRAELLVVMDKASFYRTHSFSDFQLFSVGTNQKFGAPKESYNFTNLSGQNVKGQLTVTPVPGRSLTTISVTFTIPPRASVYKTVGPGKDLNISADLIASARFIYAGVPGSVQADATLSSVSTLEVVSESESSATP